MSDESLKISFLGVDTRSKSAYEFFFKSIDKIQCEVVEDNTQSQICLIDKDAYDIQKSYEEFKQKYPEQYILFLSLTDHSIENSHEFFLKKPVKRDALQKTLNKICLLISGDEIDLATIPVITTPVSTSKTSPDTSETESTQRININSLQKKISENLTEEASDDEKIVPIQSSSKIKEKRKVVTAKAGKLISSSENKDFVGEQVDIDINDPQQLNKIYYDPSKYLQSIIEKVCIKSRQTESIIQLNVLNHVFYFDYKEQNVYSSVGPGILRPLCLIPHDGNISFKEKDPSFRTELHQIMQSNKNQKTKKTLEKQNWKMESFMWLISLWSSRGKLPKGTALDIPVYLIQWPNLTRLDIVPHAVRISALLYDQPHTLPEVAKKLGIEQRYVFGFYSACKAIGLSNTTKRHVDSLFVPDKPAENKNKSILSKLLDKLTRFRNKSKKIESA